MSKAIAQLVVSEGISEGAPGPERMITLPATRQLSVGAGKFDKFSFLSEFGQPAAMVIRGQKVFDLENPIDAHNWKLLNLLIKAPGYEEMATQFNLIDPEKDANALVERSQKELQLLTILGEKINDAEWLRKVYSRVVGPAVGIPARAMYVALTNKVKEPVELRDPATGKYGVDHFLMPDKNKWVFTDEFFETRALLDLAIQRGVILIENNDYRLKSTGKVLAQDEAKMLFVLQNDAAIADYVKERVNAPVEQRERPTSLTIEDSEYIRLAQELGSKEVTSITPIAEAIDPATKEENELSALVDDSIGLSIEKDGDTYAVDGVPNVFESRQDLIDFLKLNPQTVAVLKSLKGA